MTEDTTMIDGSTDGSAIEEEMAFNEPATGTSLEDLLRAAFESARTSGKESWNVMTVAVLKNRLLDLTDRQFSENNYGASSITDLIRNVPELFELDESVKPARVKLRDEAIREQPRAYPGRQIRRDLWNAVVDYASGERYLWSGNAAVPQSRYEGPENALTLPTLTFAEESAWRAEFAEREAVDLNGVQLEKLELWRDQHLSSKNLPGPLQGKWYEEFKVRVVDRLRKWFEANGIAEPATLLVAIRKSSPPRSRDAVDELRELIIRCIRNMTPDELRELRLPPEALLRGQR